MSSFNLWVWSQELAFDGESESFGRLGRIREISFVCYEFRTMSGNPQPQSGRVISVDEQSKVPILHD